MEYWEPSFYTVVVGLFAFFYVNMYHVPNTSAKDWAHEEAAERMRRRQAGLPVEYGVHYASEKRLSEE